VAEALPAPRISPYSALFPAKRPVAAQKILEVFFCVEEKHSIRAQTFQDLFENAAFGRNIRGCAALLQHRQAGRRSRWHGQAAYNRKRAEGRLGAKTAVAIISALPGSLSYQRPV